VFPFCVMKNCFLVKGDQVVVIAGDDKGKKGSVISIVRKNTLSGSRFFAVVEGVNLKHCFVKKDVNENGYIKREYPIDISNLSKYKVN
jgi:large subunit ribosomal protein L24